MPLSTITIYPFIQNSPDALLVLDASLDFMAYSQIWYNRFGESQTNLVGQSYFKTLKDAPKLEKKVLRECLLTGSFYTETKKYILSNGKLQWIKWKVNPWRDETETPSGLMVVQEDITEQKLQEQLLLKAKRVARIGGWEVNLLTNQVFWTSMTKIIHEVPEDYEPNLAEGINFYKEGQHRETISHLVNEAIRLGTPWDTELIIVTAKGKELWVRAMGEVEMHKGKCIRIFGTFQDINEKKKDQLKSQMISDRLAIATHNAKIGIWDYNILEKRLFWDANMQELYGTQIETPQHPLENWVASIHPEDKAAFKRQLKKAILGDEEFILDFRIVKPCGEVRFMKTESIVKKDEVNKPMRIIGANWDITEERSTQKKLKKLLTITGEQNKNLFNFAHIVSHNLRSHSSNLSMLSGFLGDEHFEGEKDQLLNLLGDATDSLNETIVHLNEVVQIKTSAVDSMRPVNIFDCLTGVQKNLALLLQDKKVVCEINVPKNYFINGILAYLDSIFLNLFTNSIKYSHPNRTPIIRIEALESNEGISLLFSDNGLGIDLERHGKKLFGMYKTFHNHKEAKGIGLFITKNQMEAMNGRIEVESTVNLGTTFTLYFNKEKAELDEQH